MHPTHSILYNPATYQLLEFVSDAVIITDNDFVIQYANKAAEKLYNLTEISMKGHVMADFVQHEFLTDTMWNAIDTVKMEGHWSGDVLVTRKDCAQFYMNASVNKVINCKGEAEGFIAVNRDLTNEKHALDQVSLLEKKNKELQQVKQDLENAQSQFMAFMENSPLPSWIISQSGEMRFMNKAYKNLTNLDDSILGCNVYDLLPWDQVKDYIRNNNRVFDSGQTFEVLETFKKPGGETVVCNCFKFPLFKDGDAMLLGGIAMDLTEKIKKQKALEQSNKRFIYASKATSDAIWEWDIKTNTIYLGQNFEEIFGYAEKETDLIGRFNLIHPEDREKNWGCLRGTMNTLSEKCQTEFRFLHADGSYRYVKDRSYILRDEAGVPQRLIGAMQDRTENKRMEALLKAKEEEKNKAMLDAAIDAQERERAEIAFELHENINQSLTTCKLMLSDLNCDSDQQKVQQCRKLLQGAINSIRLISHNINPNLFEIVGLPDALAAIAERAKSSKLKVEVLLPTDILAVSIPEKLQLVVYRIVQEQVNNILKHSEAKNASVSLTLCTQYCTIKIKDDGIGMDVNGKHAGLGLPNIRHRSEMHNGTFSLASAPGKGTTLEVKLPLPASFQS